MAKKVKEKTGRIEHVFDGKTLHQKKATGHTVFKQVDGVLVELRMASQPFFF